MLGRPHASPPTARQHLRGAVAPAQARGTTTTVPQSCFVSRGPRVVRAALAASLTVLPGCLTPVCAGLSSRSAGKAPGGCPAVRSSSTLGWTRLQPERNVAGRCPLELWASAGPSQRDRKPEAGDPRSPREPPAPGQGSPGSSPAALPGGAYPAQSPGASPTGVFTSQASRLQGTAKKVRLEPRPRQGCQDCWTDQETEARGVQGEERLALGPCQEALSPAHQARADSRATAPVQVGQRGRPADTGQAEGCLPGASKLSDPRPQPVQGGSPGPGRAQEVLGGAGVRTATQQPAHVASRRPQVCSAPQ